MNRYLIIFISALIPFLCFANEQSPEDNILDNLEYCLFECYHIDHSSVNVIISKFNSFLDNVSLHYILREFIEISKNLNIDFTTNKSIGFLNPDDAILQAPDWHKILFESNYVRIFYGNSKPGECEPFHCHQWKRIMIMLQDATFKIDNSDGSNEIGIWPIGVYELPPDITSSSYTNIGNNEFMALIFEVKS